MAFYAPAQIVRDAREHGVELRPVDINHSHWETTLEPDAARTEIAPQHRGMIGTVKNTHAVRLGFNRIKGFSEADAEALVHNRARGYDSIRDLWLRSGLSRSVLERLAEADCFRSLGFDRRAALWPTKALDPLADDERLPLFAGTETREPDVDLPPMPLGEHVIIDYRALSLSLKVHPLSFIRERLARARYRRNVELQTLQSGRHVQVSGLVLVRQRPGSARGVIFATIEDESGVANIIVWPKVFKRYRAVLLGSRCIGVRGKLQNEQGVIHIVVSHLEDLTPWLAALSIEAADMVTLANADEVRRPIPERLPAMQATSPLTRLLKDAPEIRQDLERLTITETVKHALPKGRNFH
ncbi:OB-fold nucleic acid binding domain-containing protein [Breoghania sp.]|uniref:helix-hairpin-helix domain-containing protein n=1 Tax=Breoghania sp. TaxID=2065378 RepID=UPI0032049989